RGRRARRVPFQRHRKVYGRGHLVLGEDLRDAVRHDLASLDAPALPRGPAHGSLLEEAYAARVHQPFGNRRLRHGAPMVAEAHPLGEGMGGLMAAGDILVNATFYVFAIVAIAGAVGVAASRNIVRSAFALLAV